MSEPHDPRYLKTIQVARLFRISPKTVGRWEDEGKIPRAERTIGGHRRWERSAIIAAFEANRERWADPEERKKLGANLAGEA